MKKTTLAKMDEVKHVLVERDILTATKTPWLVRLLYAFQDRDHVYLAMVRRHLAFFCRCGCWADA
jgi:non-specific serine/threonine protein kinase